MTKIELQMLFQSRYSRDGWRGFLHSCLGVTELYTKPKGVYVPPSESERGMEGFLLGELDTPDNFRIGLFEFSVTGKQAERRRVGLRNILVPWLKSGDYDAALVVFHSSESSLWRVSLICDLKDEKTAAKRFTFVFGDATSQYRTAVSRFEKLWSGGTLAGFVALREAFSVEALSKEFYAELYAWYQRAISPEAGVYFPNDPETGIDDRENLNIKIIRLITRVLFVWFIRQKNIVPKSLFEAGNLKTILKDFDPFSHASGSYYNAILQNLFFGTLNTPVLDEETGEPMRRFAKGKEQQPGNLYRYAEMFDIQEKDVISLFSRIPYMNGGLFECLDKPKGLYKEEFVKLGKEMLYDGFSRNAAKDSKSGHFKRRAFIPNFLFFDTSESEPGLFPLLERYNFTVEENSVNDADVSLDPELLGRVFENLLASYNPETRETARKATGSFYTPREIVDYMVKESLDAYMKQVEGKAPEEQLKHLLAIKVLDPACGSGAFPMGMLHAIVERAQNLGSPGNLYELKLQVIENCIFGVDIQSIAMMITKLRFFISLICEQGTMTNDPAANYGVNTLPNLETKFVAANSLVAMKKPPVQGNLFDLALVDGLKAKLFDLRKRYVAVKTRCEKFAIRREDGELRRELSAVLASGNLFEAADAEQMTAWNPYDQVAVSPFFDPEWMFGVEGGFDVVIGNPPYISHDKIPKNTLCEKFKTYEPFADIYCYFYEVGLNMLFNGGILCYITSNSFLRSNYGLPLRKYIREKAKVLSLINIEKTQVFDAAIVNSVIAILVCSDNNDLNTTIVNAHWEDGTLEQFIENSSFLYRQIDFDLQPWTLVRPNNLALRKLIESRGISLDRLGAKIRLGLATGDNRAFVITAEQRASLIASDPNNENIIKPVVRGKDIHRYHHSSTEYILLTSNEVNVVKDYPTIYQYLDKIGEKFKKRGAKGRHWTNLRACAFFDDFKKEKIVWIELADNGRFSYSEQEEYLLNSAYFMLPPDGMSAKYLLGVLNSSTIQFYMQQIAATSGMGTLRWINNYVKEFPIPSATSAQQAEIAALVDSVLAAKNADPAADTSALERQIDELVFDLYGLNQEERETVKRGGK